MLFIFVYFYFLEESLDIKRCMDMFTYEYFYLLNPGDWIWSFYLLILSDLPIGPQQ